MEGANLGEKEKEDRKSIFDIAEGLGIRNTSQVRSEINTTLSVSPVNLGPAY